MVQYVKQRRKGIHMMDWRFVAESAFRLFLAVIIGWVIGSERERHGRAAGMRTHILVCIGAAMTSLVSLYARETLGDGDVLRISAQVVSGIGFLGAGMIILRDNNMIMGLTTAAGVWTTGIIGIAVGFGFYPAALIATLFSLTTTILISKFEKRKHGADSIYVEIDDMYRANFILKQLQERFDGGVISHKFVPPRSNRQGNLGINLTVKSGYGFDIDTLCEISGVIFSESAR